MKTRLARITGAALGASALALGITPAASATTHGTYTCRSAHHPQYWYHGVSSDACDGWSGDGRFGGEVSVTVDGSSAFPGSDGPVGRCVLQLNTVRHGRARPMRGYTAQGVSGDGGRSCDAFRFWKLPAGVYNVTASYQVHGVWYTTVQGPVAHYPGG